MPSTSCYGLPQAAAPSALVLWRYELGAAAAKAGRSALMPSIAVADIMAALAVRDVVIDQDRSELVPRQAYHLAIAYRMSG